MRLLHTTKLEVHYFLGDVPDYAILSHTWEQDEIVFEDLYVGGPAPKNKVGFAKLCGCCDQARLEGFDYIW
jgi:hypothetical protein